MRNALFLFLAVLLGASSAAAQEPQSAPPVTLTVNNAELKVIGDALAAMPYKDVAPLMQKLQSQVIAQQKPRDANGNKAEKK